MLFAPLPLVIDPEQKFDEARNGASGSDEDSEPSGYRCRV
jgi:hypothetical protein